MADRIGPVFAPAHPGELQPLPTTVLHALSTAPLPMHQPWAVYSGGLNGDGGA
jgi:hypothetical protein